MNTPQLVAGKRFDVAEGVLGRDDHGRLVVEAQRPKADVWRLEVDADLAASPFGAVARHHFDEGQQVASGQHVDVWLVHHKHAEHLVEVLANRDAEGLLTLVAESIRTTHKKENTHV